jgi:hypothetical protein
MLLYCRCNAYVKVDMAFFCSSSAWLLQNCKQQPYLGHIQAVCPSSLMFLLHAAAAVLAVAAAVFAATAV